jgi:hypothetical protein
MAKKCLVSLLVLVLSALLTGTAAPQVQVMAGGLTDPFALAVDQVYVYWNEGRSAPDCRVSQCLKSAPGAVTVRVVVAGGWPDHPDLAQDSAYLYFPMFYPWGMGYSADIGRLAKAGLTAPAPLFEFYYTQDPEHPVCTDPGLSGVLAVQAGAVFSSLWDFCGTNSGEIWRLPAQGALTKEAVVYLADDGSGRVTSLTTDSVFVYWTAELGGLTGKIYRLPQGGGIATVLETLGGLPAALNAPVTGAGAGSLFWLEFNPISSQIDLKQRTPGGEINTLASGLGLFPGMEVYAARSVAVDEGHVYFFRQQDGSPQLARLPVGGGEVQVLAGSPDVVTPMSLAVDNTHVYWTDQGAGAGTGTVKRVALRPPGNPGVLDLLLGD